VQPEGPGAIRRAAAVERQLSPRNSPNSARSRPQATCRSGRQLCSSTGRPLGSGIPPRFCRPSAWRAERWGVRRPEAAEFGRSFEQNLIEVRGRVGLSQAGTAERAGLDRTEINLLEHGRRVPRLDTIVKARRALEVQPCALLRGMAWKLDPPQMSLARSSTRRKSTAKFVD
jgi:DNA-binding XRE family transcriptional regulator